MIDIKIINYTQNPLTQIGKVAAECYNTKLKDAEHPVRIAKSVISSGHGRNSEFGDLTIAISGISARMARELYTHIIGTSRLQASTRYITYNNFEFVVPEGMNEEQEAVYQDIMSYVKEGYKKLKDLETPNDIAGYVLPFAMTTTVVLKINIRALAHLAEMRMCHRALREFRMFMRVLKNVVSELDSEWEWIADEVMKPKCLIAGYCTEERSCGMKPKKEAFFKNE